MMLLLRIAELEIQTLDSLRIPSLPDTVIELDDSLTSDDFPPGSFYGPIKAEHIVNHGADYVIRMATQVELGYLWRQLDANPGASSFGAWFPIRTSAEENLGSVTLFRDGDQLPLKGRFGITLVREQAAIRPRG